MVWNLIKLKRQTGSIEPKRAKVENQPIKGKRQELYCNGRDEYCRLPLEDIVNIGITNEMVRVRASTVV